MVEENGKRKRSQEEVDHETGHVQGQGDDIHKGKGVQDDGQNEGRGVQADVRACVHHAKGRDDPGKAYVTGCIRLRLKACALMENDFPSEDFEAALYMQFWEKLDCRKVDEVNEKLKSVCITSEKVRMKPASNLGPDEIFWTCY